MQPSKPINTDIEDDHDTKLNVEEKTIRALAQGRHDESAHDLGDHNNDISPQQLEEAKTKPISMEHLEAKLPSTAAALHEVIRRDGEKEMRRDAMALFWSAIAAGLTMSTSLIGKGILQAYLPNDQLWFLIIAMGYTVGFILVICANQQLFTENTITPILPLMSNFSLYQVFRVLRLWCIVLVGNFIGGGVAAFIFIKLPIFNPNVMSAFIDIGQHMMKNTPWEMFCKGIMAGWLIATMVWILAGLEQGKIVMIFLVTYLISLGDFTHIIVGAVEAFVLIFSNQLSWSDAILQFALPTLLGNLVGGSLIFSLISHAQIRSDLSDA